MTVRTRSVGVALAAALALAPVASAPYASALPARTAEQQCQIGKTAYVKGGSDAMRVLGVPQSWRLATGRGVTVAVVDSGVDAGNAHFRGALVPGVSFVPGGPLVDRQGHGTGVAGIIGARFVKGSGLLGAAFESKIMPVRVYETEGGNTQYPPDTRLIARGIRWAADHGADVVNVSISTGPGDVDLVALRSAVRYAVRKDVVVVASAGNSDGAPVTQRRFPASFPGVIGVAATDAAGVVDDYSVHGEGVDVAAPGQNVLTTYFANGDCLFGSNPETSWAAPFVSALAAQLRQRYPDESAADIAYRITATAQRPVEGRRDDFEGWGVIQPYDALSMTFDPDRAGPPLPGGHADRADDRHPSGVRPVAAHADLLRPARSTALWWVLATTAVAALATVLRPLRRRS
ncbi:MAG: S8 family serine peptidase [Nocardioidaceae bacterium]